MLIRLNNKNVLLFLTLFSAICLIFYVFLSAVGNHSSATVELFIGEKLHSIQNLRRASKNSKHIVVFLAVEKAQDLDTEYRLAHQTLRCYCAINGYPLIVANFSQNSTLSALCPQKDFMFRRHCALAKWLANNPSMEWALFLDADMAVINPHHLIEDYIPSQVMDIDLIFYERLFNGEIAAGSYLARNVPFTVQFLHFWANYYSKLPWSWHGSDNGAIHAVFLDYFCGDGPQTECSKRKQICWKLWQKAEFDDGLRMFTDCARSVLGKRNLFRTSAGTVQLKSDFREHWTRDGWLSESKWCSRDFLLHGWKKIWQNSSSWGGWKSPLSMDEDQLAQALNLEKCAAVHAGGPAPKWPHNPKFVISQNEVDKMLVARLHEMRMTQLDYWRRIEEFVQANGQY